VQNENDVVLKAEAAEVEAWRDMYSAMPETFRAAFGAEIFDVDGVTLTRCRKIPFSHFNAVLDFGLSRPATQAQLERIVDVYQTAGVDKFAIVQTSTDVSAASRALLSANGFRAKGSWERVILHGERLGSAPPNSGDTELISADTAMDWASFLSRAYGLPTEPWLMPLVERPRWIHAALRRNGSIAAARSMYVSDSGWAWLGVEAPVPGVMAPSFDDDASVTWALLRAGLDRQVQGFVADIEAPSPERNTRAYETWQALGFAWPYVRFLYGRS
jgi:hypothetical protein